jgi:hypothetical protein
MLGTLGENSTRNVVFGEAKRNTGRPGPQRLLLVVRIVY